MNPARASSVTLHNCRADKRSSPGTGGGAFLLLLRKDLLFPWESTDVLEALASEDFRRDKEVDVRGDIGVEGRISFFCLEAGKISSRSMGTPRDMRKRRRIRERIQLGGWSGGGATSWDQREALREVRNVGAAEEDVEDGDEGVS